MEIAFSLLRCHPERHEGPHPSSWVTQAGLHKIVFWMFGRYPAAIICACRYKIDRSAGENLIEAM